MKAIKNSALGLTGIIGVVASMFGIKVPFAESLAKEHWRHGLAALLLIILMIPAAIGLFLYLVDANQFKSEIVQFVKVQTQRDLVLQPVAQWRSHTDLPVCEKTISRHRYNAPAFMLSPVLSLLNGLSDIRHDIALTSSRFAVACDTLAIRQILPLAGRVECFHLQVNAPCRAHQ